MSRIGHVAVVVPAADEEDLILECLAAVVSARDLLARKRPAVTTDIVVVLDGCRDGTSSLVAQVHGVHAVSTDARNVGAARALGTQVAIGLARASGEQVWTAHTDADSRVPPHWLLAGLRYAEEGATVVLGTVTPDLSEPLLSEWLSRHGDQDGHQHVHGANFGIRADALARLGGWPLVPWGEDSLLARTAADAGEPIVRAGGMAVATSGRRIGRAPRGFSSYLRELDFTVSRRAPGRIRTCAPASGGRGKVSAGVPGDAQSSDASGREQLVEWLNDPAEVELA